MPLAWPWETKRTPSSPPAPPLAAPDGSPRPSLDALPPLMSVAVVCRERERVWALPHVVELIDDLVDPRADISDVSERDVSVQLLRRLYARERRNPVLNDRFFRDFQCNEVANMAAARGDLEALRWLTTAYAPGSLLTKVVWHAAERGHVHVVRFLYEEYSYCIVGMEELDKAADGAHVQVVKYLLANPPPREVRWPTLTEEEWCSQVRCAVKGLRSSFPFQMTKCLYELFKTSTRCQGGDADAAPPSLSGDWLRSAEFEVLKWLLGPESSWLEVPASLDASTINVSSTFAKWLNETSVDECFAFAMDKAAAEDDLEMIKWLLANTPGGCTPNATIKARLQQIPSEEEEYWQVKAVNNVAATSDRDVSERYETMDDAAKNGDLPALQWMNANRPVGCTVRAMNSAISKGRLDIVKWLCENRSESGSPNAIDFAAQNGHLHVVRWLTANRKGKRYAKCTRRAMDMAACAGNLKMVKYLHENRSEGCTTRAMDGAVECGDFEMLLYLHANRRKGCTSDAFQEAIDSGQLEILRWLIFNYPDVCDREELQEMAYHCEDVYLSVWMEDGGFLVRDFPESQ